MCLFFFFFFFFFFSVVGCIESGALHFYSEFAVFAFKGVEILVGLLWPSAWQAKPRPARWSLLLCDSIIIQLRRTVPDRALTSSAPRLGHRSWLTHVYVIPPWTTSRLPTSARLKVSNSLISYLKKLNASFTSNHYLKYRFLSSHSLILNVMPE